MDYKPSKYYKNPVWQVESGTVNGFIHSLSPDTALRKLMRAIKAKKTDLGVIARIRKVLIGHGFIVHKVPHSDPFAKWHYFKP